MNQEVDLIIGEIARTDQMVTLGVVAGALDFEVTVPLYYDGNEVLAAIMAKWDMLQRGVGILDY